MNNFSDFWNSLINIYDSSIYGDKKDKRISVWLDVLKNLRPIENSLVSLTNSIEVRGNWKTEDELVTKELLHKLLPWRKGPFSIGDIFIDSEWRSHYKWDRFMALNLDLKDKNILDVGSGNGYYGFRMLGQGARLVICLEPNLNHLTQFAAINSFIRSEDIKMIPERVEELSFSEKLFDIIFSMGLMYHQRDPRLHLMTLCSHLKKDGYLVLETIIAPPEFGDMLIPDDRYANMSNVWQIHTDKGIEKLVNDLGLTIIDMDSSVITSNQEQRTTVWMPFRSLSSAINPKDKNLTIESLPIPSRKIFIIQE